jgi:hypothetical protein
MSDIKTRLDEIRHWVRSRPVDEQSAIRIRELLFIAGKLHDALEAAPEPVHMGVQHYDWYYGPRKEALETPDDLTKAPTTNTNPIGSKLVVSQQAAPDSADVK